MASARLGTKTARDIGGVLVAPRKVDGAAAGGFGTSPRGAETTGMLDSMRSVLKRHQCVQQQEALSMCVKAGRASAAKPSALQAGSSPCQQYVDSLRYCQLVTDRHNFPASNTPFLV